MRCLHIASTLARGGIASSLWHVLPALARIAEPEVAVLYELGNYGQLLISEGINCANLGLRHKYDPSGVLALSRLIRTQDYDVIQAHGWPAVLFTALASRLARDPRYVLTEHNISNRRRRWRLKPLDRFIYGRFDRVAAVSHAAASALVNWLPETADKIAVVYNSIDVARLRSMANSRESIREKLDLAEGQPVIVAAGSLEFRKGIDVFLESLSQMALEPASRARPGEPLDTPVALIYGDGKLRDTLSEMANRLGLSGQIRFLGFQPDLPAVLSQADLLVLSSRWEGCPMVILEAMALGLPIVATAVGGVPELVRDGQEGLVVPPENPQALRQAMSRLLDDRETAHSLGKAAKRRLNNGFLAERSAGNLAALYSQIS